MMNSHPDRVGCPDMFIMICFLHTVSKVGLKKYSLKGLKVSNCEKHFVSELSSTTKTLFARLRRIFGSRGNADYNRHSLNKPLALETGFNQLFLTTLGCR